MANVILTPTAVTRAAGADTKTQAWRPDPIAVDKASYCKGAVVGGGAARARAVHARDKPNFKLFCIYFSFL